MPVDRLGRWFESLQRRSDADLPSAARVASGTGPEFAAEDTFAILLKLAIAAVAGTTPTLDVRLETTVDDGATWYTVGSLPQQTGVTGARVARAFAPVGQRCRLAWTIGGTTPSFTFDVQVETNRDD